MSDPIHLRPTAELAERVLLPGDPGRALRLAQSLLDEPRMFNHNRGLWGYTGTAPDGAPLTIQSTGMGGPSLAIVVSELIELGARRLIRTGTCGGLDPSLSLGQLVLAREAICDDGTSRALGAEGRVAADEDLSRALAGAADGGELTAGAVVSSDLFYDARDREHEWREAGALAVEMEAATLFTLSRRRGVQAACLLLVSDQLAGGEAPVRIADELLHEAELTLGGVAARALSR